MSCIYSFSFLFSLTNLLISNPVYIMVLWSSFVYLPFFSVSYSYALFLLFVSKVGEYNWKLFADELTNVQLAIAYLLPKAQSVSCYWIIALTALVLFGFMFCVVSLLHWNIFAKTNEFSSVQTLYSAGSEDPCEFRTKLCDCGFTRVKLHEYLSQAIHQLCSVTTAKLISTMNLLNYCAGQQLYFHSHLVTVLSYTERVLSPSLTMFNILPSSTCTI